MRDRKKIYHICTALLICFLQSAGIAVFAQEPVEPLDSVIQVRDFISPEILQSVADSAIVDSAFISVADSLQRVNDNSMEKLEQVASLTDDQQATLLEADSIAAVPETKTWIPDSGKATWLAVVFPGGGQIYNRKYWKLPIIYGGFTGCAYALSWNTKTYKEYSRAYMDIMDMDPSTDSYKNYIRVGADFKEGESTDATRLKKRKDSFRRFRDISIFAFIGVYLISIIDAYVDAELSNFDIGPDLSMRVEPALIIDRKFSGNSVGIQCSITF